MYAYFLYAELIPSGICMLVAAVGCKESGLALAVCVGFGFGFLVV